MSISAEESKEISKTIAASLKKLRIKVEYINNRLDVSLLYTTNKGEEVEICSDSAFIYTENE